MSFLENLTNMFKPFSDSTKFESEKNGKTFSLPSKDDGAIEIDVEQPYFNTGSIQQLNLNEIPTKEGELLHTYRTMALNQDIDRAIQEICNEAIVMEDLQADVKLILDDVDYSETVKKKILDEFEEVLNLLNFKIDGYGIFRQWYIDGKLYFHKVVDENHPNKGIAELVAIDPLNMRLIREYVRESVTSEFDIYELSKIKEYFIYSREEITSENYSLDKSTAIQIPKDSIVYVTSGLMSSDGKTVLSQLYKSIKSHNNLKLMEDSSIIYRVSRAPEKRVIYVDVGSLPSKKADQYLKKVMDRFKQKVVYNANTGEISNRKNYQPFLEDWWLPRREGQRGTEVSTLPSAQNLGEMDDILYAKTKLQESTNVPLTRFQQESGFNIGRTTEITRDEIRFHKFIDRMRNKFSDLFRDLLKSQLILKGIIRAEEWETKLENDIKFSFLKDNYFSELKELEIFQERLNVIQDIMNSEIAGKYISHETIRKNILKQTEEEIEEEDKLIEAEKSKSQFADDEDDDGGNSDYSNFDDNDNDEDEDGEEEDEEENNSKDSNDNDGNDEKDESKN